MIQVSVAFLNESFIQRDIVVSSLKLSSEYQNRESLSLDNSFLIHSLSRQLFCWEEISNSFTNLENQANLILLWNF